MSARGPEEVGALDRAGFEKLVAAQRPMVIRGLVADWPLVGASRDVLALAAMLKQAGGASPVTAFLGDPTMDGRFFHSPDFRAFNFTPVETRFDRLVDTLMSVADDPAGPHIYMGSTPAAEIAPGFAASHPQPLLDAATAPPRLWIGNRHRVAAHVDEADNLACVVSGRRRFTLFPPEQVANLYVGPIDRTVAGQPTSTVDLADPDLARFPRFAEARRHALVADLAPGDAIFIPALWWHGVESAGPLNILVNYWWCDAPGDAGSPMHAIGHGLLAISHLPEAKRRAWRALFDHFVFRLDSDPSAHLPDEARGILGDSNAERRRTIRRYLLGALHGLEEGAGSE
ncbi:cupin-like domain-containing protein [Sphingomonas sp. ASV193]|uniref:cupin-like domain-containing protein n=1 Tax=Sphingomonas sp. ASV193 TaxID=3144405 RepID=UPI0032E9187A